MLVLCCALCVVAAPACERVRKALYSPKIKVSCQILHKRCEFTNFGDPGEACVRVDVFHFETGRVLSSMPVCSGRMDREHPRWVEVRFSSGDPTTMCMGENLKQDFKKRCQVDIIELGEGGRS